METVQCTPLKHTTSHMLVYRFGTNVSLHISETEHVMTNDNFPIELRVDFADADYDYYVEIADRLRDLARGHTDITGAAVALEQPAQGRETSFVYEASVTVYFRSQNIAAVKEAGDPHVALKEALDAIERQVRQAREKWRENKGTLNDAWLIDELEPLDVEEEPENTQGGE